MTFGDFIKSLYNSSIIRGSIMAAVILAAYHFTIGVSLASVIIGSIFSIWISHRKGTYLRGSGPFFQPERLPLFPVWHRYSAYRLSGSDL